MNLPCSENVQDSCQKINKSDIYKQQMYPEKQMKSIEH